MRLTLICAIAFAALALASCSARKPTGGGGAPSAADAGAGGPSDNAALGPSKFSAKVDGVPISGGAIDGMQLNNTAHLVPDAHDAPTFLIWLYDTNTPDDQKFTHSLRLNFAKAQGPNTPAYIKLSIILDDAHSAIYSSAKGVVTVTSMTPTRVAGAFSGTLDRSPDTPNVPKASVTITDGKFDIPMATSKLIPP
jgi:hypothetical protein